MVQSTAESTLLKTNKTFSILLFRAAYEISYNSLLEQLWKKAILIWLIDLAGMEVPHLLPSPDI